VINFKKGDIDYVCGVFPLREGLQTLEEYMKNNVSNDKEVFFFFFFIIN
jgi:hypothetical protein